MIKTAMLMAKDAYSLYFNRIKIRGSLDLEYYFRAGGLSDYLFQYDQKKQSTILFLTAYTKNAEVLPLVPN